HRASGDDRDPAAAVPGERRQAGDVGSVGWFRAENDCGRPRLGRVRSSAGSDGGRKAGAAKRGGDARSRCFEILDDVTDGGGRPNSVELVETGHVVADEDDV